MAFGYMDCVEVSPHFLARGLLTSPMVLVPRLGRCNSEGVSHEGLVQVLRGAFGDLGSAVFYDRRRDSRIVP